MNKELLEALNILEKENNLIYAVLIHLFFNLPYSFINVDIMFFVILMVVFTIEAIAFLMYRKFYKHFTLN